MTSFVNVNHPAEHPGVVRFESAVSSVRQLRKGFDGTRGLAGLLLAAIVAARVGVADQRVENWAEGHLLVVWVGMWMVAFAALALFAGTARRAATRVVTGLDNWSSAIAQARSDARLWEVAKVDPRVMADLQVAMARQEFAAEVTLKSVAAVSVAPDANAEVDLGRVLRAYPSYRM